MAILDKSFSEFLKRNPARTKQISDENVSPRSPTLDVPAVNEESFRSDIERVGVGGSEWQQQYALKIQNEKELKQHILEIFGIVIVVIVVLFMLRVTIWPLVKRIKALCKRSR